MNPLSHVAIIMDGNGRWGLKHKKSRNQGHQAGLKSIKSIINASLDLNIKYLTLFAFSTENWKRPKNEVIFLFNLLENFLIKNLKDFKKKKIKLKIIGRKNFSKKLNKLLISSEKLTKNNDLLQINLALNYGSKSEIVNAVKKIVKKKKVITESTITNNLYTKNLPDPEILIRTGNTKRLSNFLLWQLSYSEIFFENKLWPDFNYSDFIKIIKKYKVIKRNFGNI